MTIPIIGARKVVAHLVFEIPPEVEDSQLPALFSTGLQLNVLLAAWYKRVHVEVRSAVEFDQNGVRIQ